MNMFKFGLYIFLLGAVILAYGAFVYLTNLDESVYLPMDPLQAPFGYEEVHNRKVELAANRYEAIHIMIVGGIVAFIGLAMRHSSKVRQGANAGIVLLAVGIVGLIFVYSQRPPSDFGEALMMLGQGRDFYLKEPVYLTLMALFGVISVIGVINIVKALNEQK